MSRIAPRSTVDYTGDHRTVVPGDSISQVGDNAAAKSRLRNVVHASESGGMQSNVHKPRVYIISGNVSDPGALSKAKATQTAARSSADAPPSGTPRQSVIKPKPKIGLDASGGPQQPQQNRNVQSHHPQSGHPEVAPSAIPGEGPEVDWGYIEGRYGNLRRSKGLPNTLNDQNTQNVLHWLNSGVPSRRHGHPQNTSSEVQGATEATSSDYRSPSAVSSSRQRYPIDPQAAARVMREAADDPDHPFRRIWMRKAARRLVTGLEAIDTRHHSQSRGFAASSQDSIRADSIFSRLRRKFRRRPRRDSRPGFASARDQLSDIAETFSRATSEHSASSYVSCESHLADQSQHSRHTNGSYHSAQTALYRPNPSRVSNEPHPPAHLQDIGLVNGSSHSARTALYRPSQNSSRQPSPPPYSASYPWPEPQPSLYGDRRAQTHVSADSRPISLSRSSATPPSLPAPTTVLGTRMSMAASRFWNSQAGPPWPLRPLRL